MRRLGRIIRAIRFVVGWMFFEECAMSHDEELHFLRAEQNSHLFRLLLGLAVLAGLVAFGVTRYTAHQKAVKQAQVTDAAEQKWLVQTADKIGKMKVSLREADAKVAAIAEANSKPARKGGKAVSQEKWSEEGVAEYRMAQDNRVLVSNALDNLVKEYNRRRAAYSGAWPHGTEPPSALEGSR